MYVPSLTSRPRLNFHKPAITKKAFSKYIASESKRVDFKNKQLTVSIVAYNERDLVVNLVKKILSLKNADEVGVILVDNGLDADIKKELKTLPIHYIEATENLGASLGRNLVASQVTTPLMAILDADAVVEDSYIEDCLAPFKDPSVVCVRGKVIPLSQTSRRSSVYDLGESTFPHYPTTEGISVWRSADFKKSGGFEEDLYSGEGVVLCYRMIDFYGYSYEQFLYYPKLRLHHDYNSSLSQLANKEMRNLINGRNIDLRYPQLHGMKRHFNELSKDLRRKARATDSAGIVRAITTTRATFHQNTEQVALEAMEQRWNTPDKPLKNNTYKFAVILPCYKLGEHLENAVRSVMRQTIDNLQIIIVDDVSPDAYTQKVLKKLESHVTVIYHKENGGASAARNTGIKAANAQYILCLDADDTISDTYLEEAYNMFEADPTADIVSCYVEMTGERTGLWKPKDKVTIPEALLASPIPNASCYKKSVWEKTGGYDETMRGYEDWEYWVHSLSKGAKIRVLPRPHYFYFNRPGSKVKTSNKNADKIVTHIVNKHRKLYEDNMVYVIANTHKMYVNHRVAAMQYKAQIPRDINTYGFFIRNTYKVARKTKTAIEVAREDGLDELKLRARKNLDKLSDKFRK